MTRQQATDRAHIDAYGPDDDPVKARIRRAYRQSESVERNLQ